MRESLTAALAGHPTLDDACVVACGGYGKGVMTATSDLDVLVVVRSPETRPDTLYEVVERAMTAEGVDVERYPSGTSESWRALVAAHVILAADVMFGEYVAGAGDVYDRFQCAVEGTARSERQLERYCLWNVLYRRDQWRSFNDLGSDVRYMPGGLRDVMFLIAIARHMSGVESRDPVALLGTLGERGIVPDDTIPSVIETYDWLIGAADNQGRCPRLADRRSPLFGDPVSTMRLESIRMLAAETHDFALRWVASRHDSEWREEFWRLTDRMGQLQERSILAWCAARADTDTEGLVYLLARRTTCPALLAQIAARYGAASWIIRGALARNERTPVAILEDFASRPGEANADLRLFVARNKTTPRSLLIIIRDNSHESAAARRAAAVTLAESAK